MQQEPKNKESRKRFLLWGIGIASSLAAIKLFGLARKKKETVKMLTREGKLVEVDKRLLQRDSKKISTEELQSWIKK